MTTQKKCAPERVAQCDERYVLRIWLYGMVIIALVACGTVVFAGGYWKSDIENKVERVQERLDDLESIRADIDTVKMLLRSK